jgi:hypothetical protein
MAMATPPAQGMTAPAAPTRNELPSNWGVGPPEYTHSSTGGEMFGRIDHLQTAQATYKNSAGHQINIRSTASGSNYLPQTVQHNTIFAQAAGLTMAIVNGVQVRSQISPVVLGAEVYPKGSLANDHDFVLLAQDAYDTVDSVFKQRDESESAGSELAPSIVSKLTTLVGCVISSF